MDNFEIRTVFLSFFLYKNKVEWCLNAELMVAMVAIEQGRYIIMTLKQTIDKYNSFNEKN